jgi:hypothetical protein
MPQRASVLFKTGWISLAIIGLAIVVFGLIATAVPTSSDPPYLRAIGVASIGLPGLLDNTLRRRIAARQRARPPDRVHLTLACGPAAPRARILPAKGSTDAQDLVRFSTAAHLRERRLNLSDKAQTRL